MTKPLPVNTRRLGQGIITWDPRNFLDITLAAGSVLLSLMLTQISWLLFAIHLTVVALYVAGCVYGGIPTRRIITTEPVLESTQRLDETWMGLVDLNTETGGNLQEVLDTFVDERDSVLLAIEQNKTSDAEALQQLKALHAFLCTVESAVTREGTSVNTQNLLESLHNLTSTH